MWAVQVNASEKQFNWLGEVGYDFFSNKFESAADTKEHTGVLQLSTAGYIYKPWVATLDGSIGLLYRRADVDNVDSTSDNVYGNANLRLFPESRFPLRVFAEKTDSRTDTDLSALAIERTRYGFSQRYTTPDGAAMHLGYERSDQVNAMRNAGEEESREDLADLLTASFNKSFDSHNVSFDANVHQIDTVDSIETTKTAFSSLRHAYRPSPMFSSEDMLTFNRNDITLENSSVKSDIYQLNSFGFWRPSTKRPLRINGAVRAITRTTENQFDQADASSVSGSLGANYEWTDRWLFSANVGVTESDAGEEESTSSFQSASAMYSSLNYRPFGFEASWFGQLDARNNDDDGESIQEAGAQLGYNVNRSLVAKAGKSLTFRGSQSINTLMDSEDFSSQTLLTSMSLNWNRSSGSTSDMARASISDTRTIAGGERSESVEGDFQIFNLQASFDTRISNRSALIGNTTIQATRNYRPALGDTVVQSNGEWTPTASLDITYYKIALFQVARLSFHSTLRFVSNAYIPAVGEPVEENSRDDRQWENRVEYNIGRLQLRLIGRLSEIQREKQSYILFQARRMLGG